MANETDNFIKSSIGWLELINYTSNPIDTDANRRGLAFISGTLKYWTGSTWATVDSAGGATAYDDIGDPDANGSITFAGYTNTWLSTLNTAATVFTISNTAADLTADVSLVDLKFADDGDENGFFMRCYDNSGADLMFQIGPDGAVTITGNAIGTDALTITNGDVLMSSGELNITSGNINITTGGFSIGTGDIGITTGGIECSGAITTLDGSINVGLDNGKLTLGEGGDVDSYLYFDGSALVFFDAAYGSEITLSQLTAMAPSPTIEGDLTITDGKITWTDLVDEQSGTFVFANTASNDILWTSAITTGNALKIVANSATTGSMIYLESSAAGFSGEYINCFDGASSDFTVGLYGATIIAGNASTDILTITSGDLQITAGDIDVDLGIITVDNTADEGNHFKRNYNGAGTAAVMTLQSVHASGTNNVLSVVQSGTGAATAVNIDSEGTGDCVTITSKATNASVIKMTGEVATGTILEVISAASATVAALSFANSGTGATGWLGADGVGMINVACDGNLAHANASCLNIVYSGTGAASGMGTSLRIVDTGATASSYAVYISAATGEALKVDAGTVQFDEALTLGVDDTGADFKAFGATTAKFMQWDQANDLLFLTNSTILRIGGVQATPDGVTMDFDGADFDVDAVTANDNIKFGSDVDTNVIFTMAASSLTLDHGDSSVILAAGGYLRCTGSNTGKGLVIPSHATNSPSEQDIAGAGNIFFEVDANKLWVYNGAGWVGVALA